MQGGCTCENASPAPRRHRQHRVRRPVRAQAAGHDHAPTIGRRRWPRKAFPNCKQLYALLGAPDNVMLKRGEHFPHNYNAVSRVRLLHLAESPLQTRPEGTGHRTRLRAAPARATHRLGRSTSRRPKPPTRTSNASCCANFTTTRRSNSPPSRRLPSASARLMAARSTSFLMADWPTPARWNGRRPKSPTVVPGARRSACCGTKLIARNCRRSSALRNKGTGIPWSG